MVLQIHITGITRNCIWYLGKDTEPQDWEMSLECLVFNILNITKIFKNMCRQTQFCDSLEQSSANYSS